MKFFFLLLLALLSAPAYRAFFYKMRKGRFVARAAGRGSSCFETDFGKFRIDYQRELVGLDLKRGRRTVAIKDIVALEFKHRDDWALFEECCNGFGFTDLLSAYRDRIHWYTLKLVLRDGSTIPIFAAGEYEPREFLAGWYLELEASIFEWLGIKSDVAEHARIVLNRILGEFRKTGRHIPLK